jgi:hypothetical protein
MNSSTASHAPFNHTSRVTAYPDYDYEFMMIIMMIMMIMITMMIMMIMMIMMMMMMIVIY